MVSPTSYDKKFSMVPNSVLWPHWSSIRRSMPIIQSGNRLFRYEMCHVLGETEGPGERSPARAGDVQRKVRLERVVLRGKTFLMVCEVTVMVAETC